MTGKCKKGLGYGGKSKKCIGRKFKLKKPADVKELCSGVQEAVNIRTLYEQLSTSKFLPKEWIIHKYDDLHEIHCIKLKRQHLHTPTVILHLLLIHGDLTWEVHTINHSVSSSCSVLHHYPSELTDKTALDLMHTLNDSVVCSGNYDEQFIELAKRKKGKFTTTSGSCVATLEEGMSFMVDGQELYSTVRHIHCEVVSSNTICSACTKYRNTLRALVCKLSKARAHPHPKMNVRFLQTPQRSARLRSLKAAIRNKNQQLKRMRSRLEKIMEDDGVVVDDELSKDLESVIDDHDADLMKDEFKSIFFQQQRAAMKAKKTGVRWHPLMIRWCLNIMLTSSKAYDIIRESGFICLPSRRTLRDYTNWMQLQPGFNAEVLNYIRTEYKLDMLPSWKRYVTLALDEMKIREDLVFNKSTGEIIGFVNYGKNFDDRFGELREQCTKRAELTEKSVATHMLALMVRGIFFKMDIPIAQFPTTGVNAESMSLFM